MKPSWCGLSPTPSLLPASVRWKWGDPSWVRVGVGVLMSNLCEHLPDTGDTLSPITSHEVPLSLALGQKLLP